MNDNFNIIGHMLIAECVDIVPFDSNAVALSTPMNRDIPINSSPQAPRTHSLAPRAPPRKSCPAPARTLKTEQYACQGSVNTRRGEDAGVTA